MREGRMKKANFGAARVSRFSHERCSPARRHGIDYTAANKHIGFGPMNLQIASSDRREENLAFQPAGFADQNDPVTLRQMERGRHLPDS